MKQSHIEIIKSILESLTPQEFVELHQSNWKDYYLTWDEATSKKFQSVYDFDPESNDDWKNDLYEGVGFHDLIQEKYIAFLEQKSDEDKFIWINGDAEQYVYKVFLTIEEINSYIDMSLYDNYSEEKQEEIGDYFADIFYDNYSGCYLRSMLIDISDSFLEIKYLDDKIETIIK
jgi:hypothetical protein